MRYYTRWGSVSPSQLTNRGQNSAKVRMPRAAKLGQSGRTPNNQKRRPTTLFDPSTLDEWCASVILTEESATAVKLECTYFERGRRVPSKRFLTLFSSKIIPFWRPPCVTNNTY